MCYWYIIRSNYEDKKDTDIDTLTQGQVPGVLPSANNSSWHMSGTISSNIFG